MTDIDAFRRLCLDHALSTCVVAFLRGSKVSALERQIFGPSAPVVAVPRRPHSPTPYGARPSWHHGPHLAGA